MAEETPQPDSTIDPQGDKDSAENTSPAGVSPESASPVVDTGEPDQVADEPSASAPTGDPADTSTVEAMAEEALRQADQAAANIQDATGTTSESGPLNLKDFNNGSVELSGDETGIELLHDVELNVTVELGRTVMYVEDVLRLNTSSIIELDKAAGDPVDIYVNERHVARGEVLVLNENFCVRISEIIQTVPGVEPLPKTSA